MENKSIKKIIKRIFSKKIEELKPESIRKFAPKPQNLDSAPATQRKIVPVPSNSIQEESDFQKENAVANKSKLLNRFNQKNKANKEHLKNLLTNKVEMPNETQNNSREKDKCAAQNDITDFMKSAANNDEDEDFLFGEDRDSEKADNFLNFSLKRIGTLQSGISKSNKKTFFNIDLEQFLIEKEKEKELKIQEGNLKIINTMDKINSAISERTSHFNFLPYILLLIFVSSNSLQIYFKTNDSRYLTHNYCYLISSNKFERCTIEDVCGMRTQTSIPGNERTIMLSLGNYHEIREKLKNLKFIQANITLQELKEKDWVFLEKDLNNMFEVFSTVESVYFLTRIFKAVKIDVAYLDNYILNIILYDENKQNYDIIFQDICHSWFYQEKYSLIFGILITLLVSGFLCDYYGRKKTLLLAIILQILSHAFILFIIILISNIKKEELLDSYFDPIIISILKGYGNETGRLKEIYSSVFTTLNKVYYQQTYHQKILDNYNLLNYLALSINHYSVNIVFVCCFLLAVEFALNNSQVHRNIFILLSGFPLAVLVSHIMATFCSYLVSVSISFGFVLICLFLEIFYVKESLRFYYEYGNYESMTTLLYGLVDKKDTDSVNRLDNMLIEYSNEAGQAEWNYFSCLNYSFCFDNLKKYSGEGEISSFLEMKPMSIQININSELEASTMINKRRQVESDLIAKMSNSKILKKTTINYLNVLRLIKQNKKLVSELFLVLIHVLVITCICVYDFYTFYKSYNTNEKKIYVFRINDSLISLCLCRIAGLWVFSSINKFFGMKAVNKICIIMMLFAEIFSFTYDSIESSSNLSLSLDSEVFDDKNFKNETLLLVIAHIEYFFSSGVFYSQFPLIVKFSRTIYRGVFFGGILSIISVASIFRSKYTLEIGYFHSSTIIFMVISLPLSIIIWDDIEYQIVNDWRKIKLS